MQHIKESKRAENGRGMVEMLGVLAVIGVLSIGGIQGYKYAMEKHRANDIVNEVNMRVQDIWHMYQDKPFPAEFSEWGEMTQTGFPIDIVPNPNNITFSVDVENVPNGVCKQVVNEGLNDSLVKMIRIVPNNPDSEDGVIYNGDASVCEEYGDVSGMRFLATLESLNGEEGSKKPRDKNGDETTYCYEKSDCASVGGSSCFDCINNLCQPDCPSGKPYCNTENTTTPTCERCLNNSHCPKGYICDELNHACIEFKEHCEANEFRTKNGACMPCTTYSNIQVSDEPFEFKVDDRVLYREDVSGVEMCQQRCGDEGKFITETTNTDGTEKTMYCAYSCVDGYSYQANGRCVKCSEQVNAVIPNGVEKAKEQCAACGGTWFNVNNGSGCATKSCGTGTFFRFNGTDIGCFSCAEANRRNDNKYSAHEAYYVPAPGTASDEQFFEKVKEACLASGCDRKYVKIGDQGVCYTNYVSGEEFMYDLAKGAPCSDPSIRTMNTGFPEAISLCQACGRYVYGNQCKPKCGTSKWVNDTYDCVDCNSLTTDTPMANTSDAEDLCNAESCGREVVTVNGVKHCKLKARECNVNEFKNINGVCMSCDTSETGNNILVRNESDCITSCTGKQINIENGSTVTTIQRYASTNIDDKIYCVKKFSNGYFTAVEGSKQNASGFDVNKALGNSVDLAQFCETNSNRHVSNRGTKYALCELNSCGNDSAGNPVKTHFVGIHGNCVSCDSGNNEALYSTTYNNDDFKDLKTTLCNNCPNRTIQMINNIPHCVRTSCNANQFIDSSNNCQNCTNNGSYQINSNNPTHVNLCTACEGRTLIGNRCIKCNANQFVDSNHTCQNCSNAGVYTINTTNPEYAEMCTACGNRFVLGDKCIRFSYGNYGICNNHNNGNTSGYSAGEGKKLRTIENNYACGDCTKDTAFNVGNDSVGREQCASCGGNRQFVNGRCLLGHCTPPVDFMTLNGCVKCDFITGRYEIAKEDSLECKQCGDDKFVQQVGKEDDAKYYCVSKPLGRNYLKADGQEIPCDWNSEEEIGFDTTSEELCRQCGKYPFNGVCYLNPVNPV